MGRANGRSDRRERGLLVVRLLASIAIVYTWRWGVAHWPEASQPYAAGFWAWALSFPALAAVWWTPPDGLWRAALGRADILAMGVIALAAALRFYAVAQVPFSAHFDEVTGLPTLLAIDAGGLANVFGRIDASTNLPGVFLLPQWLVGQVADSWFVADRWTAAAYGVLSLAATYALGRRLFSPAVALVAVSFLAVSYWHFLYSRFQSFFLVPAFAWAAVWWALARVCASGGIGAGVGAGVVLGLALEMYDPIKVLFAVVPAWVAWHCAVTAGFARRNLPALLVACAVAYMVLAPVLRNGWDAYAVRLQQVTAVGDEYRGALGSTTSDIVATVGKRLLRQARVVTGGAEVAANVPSPGPLLNPFEVAALALGVLFSLRRWRDWRYTPAPLTIAVTSGAVLLSSVPDAGYRLAVALPAIALAAALGVVCAGDELRRRAPARRAGAVLALSALALLGADAWWNARSLRVHLDQRQMADTYDVLGRAIAASPADAVYYVEETSNIFANRVFGARTSKREIVSTPNLEVQLPDAVDAARAAVFVITDTVAQRSLPLLKAVYPSATSSEALDAAGRRAGYLIRVEAGAQPKPLPARDCGLQRDCAGSRSVDATLAFFAVDQLCPEGAPVEWRGSITVPETSVELGVDLLNVDVDVYFDGARQSLSQDWQGSLQICPTAGVHEIAFVAHPRAGPTPFRLWWAQTGQPAHLVPCAALRPNAT